MNNTIAKPRKPTTDDLAKLVSARAVQLYELTPANALPTVAKVASTNKPGARYYRFVCD